MLTAGSKPGVADYFKEEKERVSAVVAPVSVKSLLQAFPKSNSFARDALLLVDGLDKAHFILVQAVGVTSAKVSKSAAICTQL